MPLQPHSKHLQSRRRLTPRPRFEVNARDLSKSAPGRRKPAYATAVAATMSHNIMPLNKENMPMKNNGYHLFGIATSTDQRMTRQHTSDTCSSEGRGTIQPKHNVHDLGTTCLTTKYDHVRHPACCVQAPGAGSEGQDVRKSSPMSWWLAIWLIYR